MKSEVLLTHIVLKCYANCNGLALAQSQAHAFCTPKVCWTYTSWTRLYNFLYVKILEHIALLMEEILVSKIFFVK